MDRECLFGLMALGFSLEWIAEPICSKPQFEAISATLFGASM